MHKPTNKYERSVNRAAAQPSSNAARRVQLMTIEDNRSEALDSSHLQQQVDVSLASSPLQLQVIQGPVIQRGKYDDREFIGPKTKPSHVHIYNKQEGHVKVDGETYKYGQKAEHGNMLEAKKALEALDSSNVDNYDEILEFVNYRLSFFQSEAKAAGDDKDEFVSQSDDDIKPHFKDMTALWKHLAKKKK